MLWCIARIGYTGKYQAGDTKYNTTELRMLESDTLKWVDVPVDSVEKVLFNKKANIGNLVLNYSRKVCTLHQYRLGGNESSINTSELPFIEKSIMSRGSDAVAKNLYSYTNIALINDKFMLSVGWDGSYRLDTPRKTENVVMDYKSRAVCKIREELKNGAVVEKAEMRAAVLGVECEIVNDGSNVVYIGNKGKNVGRLDVDVSVHNGVTKITKGAIETYGDAILPETVKELEEKAIMAGNIRTDAIIEKGHSSVYMISRDKKGQFTMPKFTDDADVTSFIGYSEIRNVVYKDYGKKYEYKDRALSGTGGVVSVALMNSEDITIGTAQFYQCNDLTNIITPNGKIVEVKPYAFCRTVVSNIDLSHCKRLDHYLFREPDECEKERFWGWGADAKRAEMRLIFKENIDIKTMALYGGRVARIDFLGDEIELEKNSLYCSGIGVLIKYKSERVGKILEAYKRTHPGHITVMQKI